MAFGLDVKWTRYGANISGADDIDCAVCFSIRSF